MTDDDLKDPLDVVLDAGSKAMLAAMAGDREEEQKQIARGRVAMREVKKRQLLHSLDEAMETTKRSKSSKKRRNQRKKRPEKKVGTNLGDLLKDAGVTASKKEKG